MKRPEVLDFPKDEKLISDEIKIFLDSTRHGSAVIRGSKIIYANPKVQEYTGYPVEELMGMDFFRLTDEKHMKQVMEAAERIMKDPETEQPIEVPVIRKDGDIRHLRIDGSLINLKGEALILISALDMTDKLEALDKLQSSEQKYLSVLEHSPNNVYLADLETMRIIEANSTLQNLLGYTEKELLQMTPYDFIAHEESDVNREVEKLPSQDYGFVGHRKYITKDGKLIDVEVSANIIDYRGRKAITVVSWDVTALKKVQEEMMDLNEVLRLISRITRHDIRNRLTVAYGILDLLVGGYELQPSIIEEANKSVRKAIDITKRMNELERLLISGEEMKRTDLKESVENVIIDYPVKYQINGNCEVVVDSAFYSVTENLIGNAINHGGADRIIVNIKKNSDFVLISFSDNGRGVDEKIREKIFQDSFSYGENKGTGIGLYIVRKIIEKYGGEVWLDDNSEFEKGATFVLKLPMENSKKEKILSR